MTDRRGARRRSTSVGEEDILSSTLDMPEASSTNRFSNFNPDRCVSTPQIDVTSFIDDTYHDNRGTGLEERIRTRSNKGSNSIDLKLRDDFTRLKIAVFEWGEIACSCAHLLDVIDKKHSALCAQIELKISEVLLGRGDFGLVGELGGLKDKLNAVRKEAKQLSQAQLHENRTPLNDERTEECSRRELSLRNCTVENVFLDDPTSGDQRSSSGGSDMNLSRIVLTSNNVNTVPVVACGQGTMSNPSPPLD